MQTILSECQQDFHTLPPTVMQAVLVTYFIRTDVFQLFENFCNVQLYLFLDCFFRKSLSGHLDPTSTGEIACKREKDWDIQKACKSAYLLVVFRNNASYYCLTLKLPCLGR